MDGAPDVSDIELVAKVVAHEDAVAFGELVRRHQSHVRNFLRKLSRDFVLADDLAQDTFLQAWNKIHTFSGRGSFIGWLLKVAYTTFLQSKRKSSRYDDIMQSLSLASATGDRSTSSEIPDLEKFLAVLSEEERAAIIMSYACGLSHREIGIATDMPVGTVKSIIHRSKLKIREHFEIKDHQHG